MIRRMFIHALLAAVLVTAAAAAVQTLSAGQGSPAAAEGGHDGDDD